MALTAADVIDSARGTLLDAGKVAWSDAELIGYLNEALRATSGVKPDMYTKRGNIEMQGGTLQELPEDGVALIDVFENTYTGEVVTMVDLELLNESNRFWPVTDRQRGVDHFSYDSRDPLRFKIAPPNDGTGEVRAMYGAVPPALTDASDALVVSDVFQPALVDYVLHRAYAKNSKRQDLTKSQFHKQQWGTAVGLKTKAQTAIAPKVSVSEGKA